jgi:hypothetical protein
MSTTMPLLKKVNTDVSSVTADISIRKQQKNNTLIGQQSKTKLDSNQLIMLENVDNLRKDIFGNEIKKGGKQKVSFIDNPILNNSENENLVNLNKSENEKIVEVVNVESYKEYNKFMLFNMKKEIYPNESICCESCYII